MKKKEDALQDIARLWAVSPARAQVAFEPIYGAVDAFFAADSEMEKHMGDAAFQVAYNYEYRNTIYKNQEVMPAYSDNFPTGYKDVRDLFAGGGVWDEIAAVDETEFVEAFRYEEAGGGSVSKLDTGGEAATNPYLDDWTARIEAARAGIVPGLKAIIEFCEGAATTLGTAIYFEDHGGIESAPTRREVADRVYIQGGYLEVIQTYGLGVYVPSYFK